MYEALHFFASIPLTFLTPHSIRKSLSYTGKNICTQPAAQSYSIMQITTPLPSFRLVLKSYWAASDVPSSRRRLSISRTDFAINLLCLAFSQCRLPASRGKDCSPTPIPYFPMQTKRYWTKWSFLVLRYVILYAWHIRERKLRSREWAPSLSKSQ